MFARRIKDQFLAALAHPRIAQEQHLLEQVIAPNTNCMFGRRHRFGSIASVQDFREAVEIRGYESFRPDIERMLAGENAVLVAEPIRHFFITSGSTSEPKYVPVTNSFVRDKSRAFATYWSLVFERHPECVGGKIITNLADSGSVDETPSGIPCSSESAFWSRVTAATRNKKHFVPPRQVSAIKTSDDRYYVLARLLLEEDFSIMMSLNPSTIVLLMRKMNEFGSRLLDDLAGGSISAEIDIPQDLRRKMEGRCRRDPERAARLREAMRRESELKALQLWPSLRLIISWRSRVLSPYLNLLRHSVNNMPHADYISMASEGVLSIPVETGTSGGVVAVNTHFYEFLPVEQEQSSSTQPLLVDELERGRRYEVVLTTTAGLYRYRIGDVVEVTGYRGATPVIDFVHRSGSTCSITGEKLTEEHVSGALHSVCAETTVSVDGFTAIPSREGYPHYIFLVEFSMRPGREKLRAFLAAMERELGSRNTEYHGKRDSQRLGAPELWVVGAGEYEASRQRLIRAGRDDGQIKSIMLNRDSKYHEQFHIVERIREN